LAAPVFPVGRPWNEPVNPDGTPYERSCEPVACPPWQDAVLEIISSSDTVDTRKEGNTDDES